MQKKVTSLEEARAHFTGSIDTVTGEREGADPQELTTRAEAEAYFSETTDGDASDGDASDGDASDGEAPAKKGRKAKPKEDGE